MDNKKLAIVINSLIRGGTEKIVSLIINRFHVDYEIHLILLNATIDFELPFEKIKVVTIDNSDVFAKSRVKDILKLPILAFRLKKYLESNDIKVCYSFLSRPNFISGITKILGWKGYSLLGERGHTSSIYLQHTISGKLGRYLVRNLYKKADIITANSFGIEEDLKVNFNLSNKSKVIYNPINIALHDQMMQEPIENFDFENCFTFIFVARFHPHKNHKALFEAIRLIKDKKFQVLLIGRGELEKKLKELSKITGIADKVRFLGFKANVCNYLNQSDCFVMSSLSEGFPNALLEALASGVPVISTDCPTGPRELLTGSFDSNRICKNVEKGAFGILVPNNDPRSLADAMSLMMDDHDLRKKYSINGRQRAMEFNQPNLLKEFKTMLDEAFK
jgi:N-acetylgalactosamine-N,N'-diacetylbacillosaminyl-diphospho-undecaprenol 4-alpha-N-acetylgalactosaminyltransferase